MEILIKPMCLNDIDRIMIIENECFDIPWSRMSFETELEDNEHAVYITASVNDEIVGYGGMWKIIDEAHITNIAIHPAYRRMHIGSAIVEKLHHIASNYNINNFTLEVRASNVIAQKLYQKYGYKIAGRRKRYYADNHEDALIMWKENTAEG